MAPGSTREITKSQPGLEVDYSHEGLQYRDAVKTQFTIDEAVKSPEGTIDYRRQDKRSQRALCSLGPLAFGFLVALVTALVVGGTVGGAIGGSLAQCRSERYLRYAQHLAYISGSSELH